MKNKFIFWIFPFIFLIFSLITLSDYGLNWDSAKHFGKGQAYLHYILTGNKNYNDLEKYPSLTQEKGGPADYESFDKESIRLYEEAVWEGHKGAKRSYYQSVTYQSLIDGLDGYSHPAGNDMSAALTNYIFYQKLGILGDYEAHNLFIVIISFVSVLVVSYFVFYEFGGVAALLAGFFYGFYPLFFAESHFNIKDPVITAYITITIIAFYYAVRRKSYKLLFVSSIFAGLGLSTKLNIVFAPVILAPWLFVYMLKGRKKIRKYIKFYLSFIAIPTIAFGVFVLTWPYLWHNIPAGVAEMLMYYLDIGRGGNNLVYEPYIYFGFNFYPIYFISTTTPISMLILFLFGFTTSIYRFIKDKNEIYILLLLWFLIPVIRVSTPSATIYGGVRQIMEYLPAMAILAGVGGWEIYNFYKSKRNPAIILGFVVFVMAWEMAAMHPNQNVYFNQLVGGLSGAASKNIPYWGNSFGNAYLQGIEWLNQNAEPNAKVANILFSDHELPFFKLRSDISLSNEYFSGSSMNGEYVLEMALDLSLNEKIQKYEYLKKLKPVYQEVVQGQSIINVYINSKDYLN